MYQILEMEDYNLQKLESSGGGTEYETVTTEKSETIFVEDVAKRKGKLIPYGRTFQKQLNGTNLLDEETIKNTTFSEGTYKYTLTNIQGGTLYFKASLKEGKTPINGVYVAISSNGANPNNGTSIFSIKNGSITNETTVFTIISNIYFAVYPKTISIEELFETYNFWVSETDTTYEAYCGGVPSPNPDYPQNINNVEGNISIKVANGEDETQEGYQERSILFPLSDGQKLMEGDYFDNDGVHHLFNQKTLDGTEDWQILSSTAKYTQFSIVRSALTNAKISGKVWSNYFIQTRNDRAELNNVYVGNNYFNVCLDNSIASTVEGFKRWLAEKYANGSSVIIEYELAKETIDTYTPVQQEAYNILKNCKLFKGTNYIFTVMETLKPNLQLTYYKEKEE